MLKRTNLFTLLLAVLFVGSFSFISCENAEKKDKDAEKEVVVDQEQDGEDMKCGEGKCGEGKCGEGKEEADKTVKEEMEDVVDEVEEEVDETVDEVKDEVEETADEVDKKIDKAAKEIK